MNKQTPIISINNISKRYKIDSNRFHPQSIRDIFTNMFNRTRQEQSYRELWALNDVSLDIHKGDRYAIMGLNGAGKSTLLKTISRIVSPTKGYIDIYGTVTSLIELGIGFHPELSGRDNIFLNGVMLGMKKRDVHNEYDKIVSFSELEHFLETPIKHYSNGMQTRLGFSIAAHLYSDILIVDEVLSVGDQYFQEKCLKRLYELCDDGKTILFVSHNLSALQSLCNKGVVLEHGKVAQVGDINSCIAYYTKRAQEQGQ